MRASPISRNYLPLAVMSRSKLAAMVRSSGQSRARGGSGCLKNSAREYSKRSTWRTSSLNSHESHDMSPLTGVEIRERRGAGRSPANAPCDCSPGSEVDVLVRAKGCDGILLNYCGPVSAPMESTSAIKARICRLPFLCPPKFNIRERLEVASPNRRSTSQAVLMCACW